MPREPGLSRALIPLLVAVLGIILGTGGLALLRKFTPEPPTTLAATAAKGNAGKALSQQAIEARIEPSVVDVTATLTYDDETASGTGFVVDAKKVLIVTNNHVIRDATEVSVTIPATGQSYTARIVGADVPADIAVLEIKPVPGLKAAPIGDSADLDANDKVISFGNQAGAGGSPAVGTGMISGTARTIQAADGASGFSETLHNMLATTAKIEPGDSGGPLAGTAGTVIGVDTAAGTGGTSTGYAIPINAAMAAERQITEGRPAPGVTFGVNGFLGVVVGSSKASSPAKQRAQEHRGTGAAGSPGGCVSTKSEVLPPTAIAPVRVGALVIGVLCGTGAASAGIASGDVITEAAGRRIGSPNELTAIVNGSRPGSVVSVTWVSRSGTLRTSQVRLGAAPAI
ncbi:PDZ domain-containing protein [Trebonia kvetii]|uniref:PDZ domain-containing protein n=1 Tax=Trebonia kvetii TaxID=2480626 RepID=A0A6P2C594_9ACTN|nr:trypsin-like peptidase domain-containing protein [Trebonia kvetii]TVZ06167.1 PDZ domain-containing protein [Trebonia kvetii]